MLGLQPFGLPLPALAALRHIVSKSEPLPACLRRAGRCPTFAGVVKRLLAVKREGCEAIAWAQVFYRDTLLGLSPTMDRRRLRAGVFKLKSKGVTQVWIEPRSRRYGLIIKEFLVGKDDFSCFGSFGGFRGIFGKRRGFIIANSLGALGTDQSLQWSVPV